MTIKDIIHKLVENVARASSADDRLRPFGDFAVRAIASSAGRALSMEKGLSTSARTSLCASAMSFVATAVDIGIDSIELRGSLKSISKMVALLAPIKLPDHVEGDDQICPEGWSGDAKGPFRKVSPDGIDLVIARRPHLPGGDWAVFYGGVATSFGETPESAANKADILVAILGESNVTIASSPELYAPAM